MLQETTITDTLTTTTTTKEKTAPNRFKLTDPGIKSLAAPAVGQTMYLDAIVPSFGVRVSASGVKTFIVQGRIKGEKHPTRLKIGGVGIIALAAARERAREFLTMMEAGKHPDDVRKTQQREREAQEQATRVAAEHSFAAALIEQDIEFRSQRCFELHHLRPWASSLQAYSQIHRRMPSLAAFDAISQTQRSRLGTTAALRRLKNPSR